MSEKIELYGYVYEWDEETRIIKILSKDGARMNLKVYPPEYQGRLSEREKRNKKFWQPIYDQLVDLGYISEEQIEDDHTNENTDFVKT